MTARRVPRWARIGMLLVPALAVVVVFFVAGFGAGLAQSFGYQPFLPGWHWSTRAWHQLAADPAVRGSFVLSARVAVLSTAAASLFGTAFALGVHRLGAGRRWAAGLLQVNLAVPHLVGALCILLLLDQAGLLSRLTHGAGLTGAPASFPALTADRFGIGIIVEYAWKETPFVAVIALGALGRASDEFDDAARMLGANRSQRLRHVTVPLLAPAVASAGVLVFAFAAGSYEVPFLLGRPYPATLPVVAYQQYSSTDLSARPEAMAVAVTITVLSLLFVAAYLSLVTRLTRRTV